MTSNLGTYTEHLTRSQDLHVLVFLIAYLTMSYGMPRILNLRLHNNLYFLVFYPNTEPTLLDFKLEGQEMKSKYVNNWVSGNKIHANVTCFKFIRDSNIRQ